MRHFLSKSVAGGLSAGVVLLWWPLLFPAHSLASWLGRGVAWTVCVELLLLALGPLEAAIWETRGGERLIRRARKADARLRSGSRRRTMMRLATIAVAALAVPAALLAAGLKEQPPKKATAQPMKVVEVTRVVRPVTVKRVQRVIAPAAPAAPIAANPPAAASPSPAPASPPKSAGERAARPKRTQAKPPVAPVTRVPPERETPTRAPVESPDEAGSPDPPPAATGSRI